MTTLTLRRDLVDSLVKGCTVAGIREPDRVDGISGVVSWTPDLTPAEQTTLATIQTLVLGGMLITPAERNAIQSDIDGLVTYQGLANPTLAQTVLAVKAQSRILRAILRS